MTLEISKVLEHSFLNLHITKSLCNFNEFKETIHRALYFYLISTKCSDCILVKSVMYITYDKMLLI